MIKSIILSTMVAALFVGCGGLETATTGTSGSGGSNASTLDTSDANQFIITTTANNVGTSATYYHVAQEIDNASLNTVLNTGTNYSGTITTTCVKGTVSATTVQYACTTVHNTSAPFNIPNSANNVTLNIGETNKVYQAELTLSNGATRTQVGTITAQ